MAKKGTLNFASFIGGVIKTDEAPLSGDKLWLGNNAILDSEGFIKKRNGSQNVGDDYPFDNTAVTELHALYLDTGVKILTQSGKSLQKLSENNLWEDPEGITTLTSSLELKGTQYGNAFFLLNGTDFIIFTGDEVTDWGLTTVGASRRCIAWQNRLWIYDDPTADDRLYYSALDDPETFTGDYYRIQPRVGGRLMGVVPTMQMLLLVKNNSIFAATGSPLVDADTDAFDIVQLYSGVGCIASDTLVPTGNGFICLWHNGIYYFQVGTSPINITQDKFNDFMSDLDMNLNYVHKCSAEFFDKKYILFYPSGDSSYADKGLIIDFKFDNLPCTFIDGLKISSLTKTSHSVEGIENTAILKDPMKAAIPFWESIGEVTIEDGTLIKASYDTGKADDTDTAGVGSGTLESPYYIRTAADLDLVRNHMDAYFKQLSNISIVGDGPGGDPFLPIGAGAYSITTFTGVYDGDGYSINMGIGGGITPADITIGGILYKTIGLFAHNKGDIKNLNVTFQMMDPWDDSGDPVQIDMLDDKYVIGGIAAINGDPNEDWNTAGWIYNCKVTFFCSLNFTKAYAIGGLAGISYYSGKLDNSKVYPNIAVCNYSETTEQAAKDYYVGGLVGWANCFINNCHVFRKAASSIFFMFGGYVLGGRYTGGLAGYISDAQVDLCTVRLDSVMGAVGVGGMVGKSFVNPGLYKSSAIVDDIYKNTWLSSFNVYDLVTSSGVGGLVGIMAPFEDEYPALTRYHSISNCYARNNEIRDGVISYDNAAGGLVGRIDSENYLIVKSYSVCTKIAVGSWYDDPEDIMARQLIGVRTEPSSLDYGLKYCYFDNEEVSLYGYTDGADEEITSDIGDEYGEGHTTYQMFRRAYYTAWDFVGIWTNLNDWSYPDHGVKVVFPYNGASKSAVVSNNISIPGSASFKVSVTYSGSSHATEGFFLGRAENDSSDIDTINPLDDTAWEGGIGFIIKGNRIYVISAGQNPLKDTTVDIETDTWVQFRITLYPKDYECTAIDMKFEYRSSLTGEWQEFTVTMDTYTPNEPSSDMLNEMKWFMCLGELSGDDTSILSLKSKDFAVQDPDLEYTKIERQERLFGGTSEPSTTSTIPGKVLELFKPGVYHDDTASITFEVGGGWNHEPIPGQRKKILEGTVEFESEPGDLSLYLFADEYDEENPDYEKSLHTNTSWVGVKRKLIRFKKHLNYKRIRWILRSTSVTDVRVYALQMFNSIKRSIFSTDMEV